MPFLGERHQNIFMVSWTCRRALLNWPTLRSGGVFRLRGATAISQQARAAEGLLGKMPSRSILEGAAVARCCHGAFSGARRWQNAREMRSSASDGGNILARCVPGCLSVASFALHASPRGPRTGKSPIRGKIRAPCIRKALQTAVWEYTARRSCHEGAAFAARTPRIMHGAQILPFLGAPFERFDLFRVGWGGARVSRTVPVCAGWHGCFAGSPYAAPSCSPLTRRMLLLSRPPSRETCLLPPPV